MIWRKILSIVIKEKPSFGNLEHLEKLAEDLNAEYFRTFLLDYASADLKKKSVKKVRYHE